MEDLKKKKNDSQGSNELTESTHRLCSLEVDSMQIF